MYIHESKINGGGSEMSQRIQFDGRECIVISPEDYDVYEDLQSQLALHDQALDLKNKQLTTALNDLAAANEVIAIKDAQIADVFSDFAAANERADGLQRIVDAAMAQKPVEWKVEYRGTSRRLTSAEQVQMYRDAFWSVTELYASAPVPAQPAVVPEVVREFSELHERHVYAIRTKNRDSAAYSCAGQLFEKRGNFLLALASPHTISAESFKLHYEALKVALPTWPDAILSTTGTEVKNGNL